MISRVVSCKLPRRPLWVAIEWDEVLANDRPHITVHADEVAAVKTLAGFELAYEHVRLFDKAVVANPLRAQERPVNAGLSEACESVAAARSQPHDPGCRRPCGPLPSPSRIRSP
jgi:hypothetical protein